MPRSDFVGAFRKLIPIIGPIAFLLMLSACTQRPDGDMAPSDTLAGDTALVAPGTTAVQSIYQTLQSDGRFSQFVQAIDSIGLTQTLSGPGPFTVFAPTNEAFTGTGDLLGMAGGEDIRGVMLYHISNEEFLAEDLAAGMAVPTLEGSRLSASVSGDSVDVGGARIIEPNIDASNGVVHAIDMILRPGSETEGM